MRNRSKTYIACRRPIILTAERVFEQQTIETWEGRRTAYPGDFVMTGTEGEHWPVTAESFDRLYDIIAQDDDGRTVRVQKKPLNVPCYQVYQPIDFIIRAEPFHAEAGYFLIYYSADDIYPCAPDVFFDTFELLRPAEAAEDFDVFESARQPDLPEGENASLNAPPARSETP